MTVTAWTSGEQCELHFLAYCADCRDQASLRRDAKGGDPVTNLTAVTGGAVHAPMPSGKRPLCQPGHSTGLGTTGRKRTTYRETAKPVTCKRCLAAADHQAR
jgi:hypothetical protein